MSYMVDRRAETRMLCADLVKVRWTDRLGRNRKAVANLEDISFSGVCLQMDTPLPIDTTLHIHHDKAEFDRRLAVKRRSANAAEMPRDHLAGIARRFVTRRAPFSQLERAGGDDDGGRMRSARCVLAVTAMTIHDCKRLGGRLIADGSTPASAFEWRNHFLSLLGSA